MVAGWNCPDKRLLELSDGKGSTPPRTAVCKLHELNRHVAKQADVILMSHRDPYHSICSRKMEHMWCKEPVDANGRYMSGKDPMYKEAVEQCKQGDEVLEVKGQCQVLMGLQAGVYAGREVSWRACT